MVRFDSGRRHFGRGFVPTIDRFESGAPTSAKSKVRLIRNRTAARHVRMHSVTRTEPVTNRHTPILHSVRAGESECAVLETVATFDSVSKIADANPPSASRPTLTTVGRFSSDSPNSAADGLGPIAAMGTARTVFDLRELHKKDRA
ncbi:hypothetical protein EVAR_61493_1 [Eumeta japonica]|uniref:Uncharacterized protein n=1 Tax=Eumeta variegata TaxID=151549 RepID=A0A4C2A474_EUMVA|nr:hypothetical protein EVAR_61493_1 [Eumeta japonica]